MSYVPHYLKGSKRPNFYTTSSHSEDPDASSSDSEIVEVGDLIPAGEIPMDKG